MRSRILLTFRQFHSVDTVGNTPKGPISKRVFQENRAPQIFWKRNIPYPIIRTCTCTYQGARNVRFSENLAWLPLFPWNSRFEICPFGLLTTIQRILVCAVNWVMIIAISFSRFLKTNKVEVSLISSNFPFIFSE